MAVHCRRYDTLMKIITGGSENLSVGSGFLLTTALVESCQAVARSSRHCEIAKSVWQSCGIGACSDAVIVISTPFILKSCQIYKSNSNSVMTKRTNGRCEDDLLCSRKLDGDGCVIPNKCNQPPAVGRHAL
jgi:hypothetical protein